MNRYYSIYQIYESKPRAIATKSDFINECLAILVEREKNDPRWIALNHKAPSRDVVINYLTRRTPIKDALYKEALSEGLDTPVEILFRDEDY